MPYLCGLIKLQLKSMVSSLDSKSGIYLIMLQGEY